MVLPRSTWDSLRHAYGVASNVPDLLDQVVADPNDAVAWDDLWSALCHQESIYSASFAAVIEIVAIAADSARPASYNFFALPAAIELQPHLQGVTVPSELRDGYATAIGRLPQIAKTALDFEWDENFTHSVLGAVAVSKGQYRTARLLLDIDGSEIEDLLDLHWSR